MKILSLETASEICSVAILENNNIIKELNIENGNTHSQNLMPLISELLRNTNLTLNDIDLFACDNCPGSFTGIRIGIATLKAFRDVTFKPVIGISSLKSLAYNIQNTSTDIICSIIDAKNNNIYYGLFKNIDNKLYKIDNYSFDNITSLLNYLKAEKFSNKKIFFVGNGSIVYKDVIQSELNKQAIFSENIIDNKLNSVSIGKAAFDKFLNSNINNYNNITPLYLKKSSAELALEEKNK